VHKLRCHFVKFEEGNFNDGSGTVSSNYGTKKHFQDSFRLEKAFETGKKELLHFVYLKLLKPESISKSFFCQKGTKTSGFSTKWMPEGTRTESISIN
jgi:hypothetical protein